MVMTPSEIVREYRQARDRRRMLQVLADLCLCTREDIRELLTLCGEEPPPPQKKQGGRKPFPREELRAALDAGWTDEEIRAGLGVSKSTIWRWRREERQKEVSS